MSLCVHDSGATVCAAVIDACDVAAVVTLGGVAIPCTAALRSACVVGAPSIGQICSDYVCNP
jgi:hypothetical protein